MKLSKLYIASVLTLASAGIVGCSDNFDTPPMIMPSTDIEANITISELKTKYWDDARNYIDTIGLAESGDSLYIKARVISSDESGNIYNNLYIQDETGALCLSIRYPDMFNTYRVGQEVVLTVSQMYIGKYNGLQQLGQPEYTDQYGWEASFMSREFFESHVRLNGLPNLAKVDTIPVNMADLADVSKENLIKLQGQLVRFDNVHFAEADGTTTFAESDASTNRTLVDDSGNELIVRNSNYANFRGDILPLGNGTVVGILGFYGTTWQLVLRDTKDLIGFSTDISGTEASPYTIEQAIELQGSASGWVTGYIVGAVAPEKTTVASNSDIEWTAPTTLDNTLVIGMNPDTRDISQCIVMELPQNSALRAAANLRDNPAVHGTQIWVKGKLESYMGTYGLTGNSGARGEYKMSVATGGLTSLVEEFSGSDIPSDWTNYVASGDKDWFISTYNNDSYASMTGYKGNNPPFDAYLISPALDLDNASKKVFSFDSQVAGYGGGNDKMYCYLMSSNDPTVATILADVTEQITWAQSTTSSYSGWVPSGDIDLSAYSGTIYIGIRYYAESRSSYDTWCIDNFRFGVESGESGGGEGGDQPGGEVITATRADFETFGTPSGFYSTLTSADGWVASNCSLLAGSADAAATNPYFQFIGYVTGSTTEFAYAPCMNGNTSRTGTIVSPTIAGGCGELTFNFGVPFSETDPIGFRVDIKQNGSVVKTFTIEGTYPKTTAESHTETINVSGEFSIEFVNISPSGLAENKNRVCVWNVSWTNY